MHPFQFEKHGRDLDGTRMKLMEVANLVDKVITAKTPELDKQSLPRTHYPDTLGYIQALDVVVVRTLHYTFDTI